MAVRQMSGRCPCHVSSCLRHHPTTLQRREAGTLWSIPSPARAAGHGPSPTTSLLERVPMTSQLHSRIALRGQAGDFHVHLTVHNASQLEHATHVVEANYRSVCGRWRPAAARAHRLYLRLLLAKRTRKFSLVRCSPGGEIAVRCTFHVEYADYEPDLSAAGDECLKHQGAAPHPMIFIVAHVPESRTAAGSRPTEHH